MDATRLLDVLRGEMEAIRAEYIANGRGGDFDRMVELLKAEGRWPFEE